VAAAGEDGVVYLWDAASGQLVHALSGHGDEWDALLPGMPFELTCPAPLQGTEHHAMPRRGDEGATANGAGVLRARGRHRPARGSDGLGHPQVSEGEV
jgi:hypothetical protein